MNPFDTSEYKITYLLGAGASANALPTVKMTSSNIGIALSMINAGKALKDDSSIDSKYHDFILQINEDLKWVAEGSDKFGTPDTFAKYLYLKDRNSLTLLKETLSFYFIYEQTVKAKIEKRTLSFLTTVMPINIFPTNIKILNWNYDFQMQIAGEEFQTETYVQTHGGSVHSPPLIGYFPTLGRQMSRDMDVKHTSLVHLNGIAGFYFIENRGAILNTFLNKIPSKINDLIEMFTSKNLLKHNLLTFAWERDTVAAQHLQNRLTLANAIIENTNILVIIGYSFPFFNCRIDSQIFETLKKSKKFTKIYFQDPYRSGEFVRKQFGLPENIEILNIIDVENYFVPHEL